MQIKRSGIYKPIDSKDFGIYQQMGWEKVIAEPAKVVEPKPVIEEPKAIEPEPIVEEVKAEEPIIEEEPRVAPKPKKKKNV